MAKVAKVERVEKVEKERARSQKEDPWPEKKNTTLQETSTKELYDIQLAKQE